jgi:hypothetical protein
MPAACATIRGVTSFHLVIRVGVVAVHDGVESEARPGRLLRRDR